jgi:hypothetical protein
MIIEILIALAAIIVVLAIVIAMRPSDFCISRSATFPAPASTLFEQVNDLHRWEAWSPWDRIDPNSKKTFTGPKAGVGASYSWVGEKTGEGSMTLTESRPNELIRIKLDFVKPFKANNTAEFTFKPKGDQTIVTWSMSGKNNFAGKAFSLIVNCDKMCGGEFEKGLANLKSVTEKITVTANH